MGFCPKCGAQLQDGMKFCTSCGSPIETAQPVMNQQAPQGGMPTQQDFQQQNFQAGGYPQQAAAPAAPKQPSAFGLKMKALTDKVKADPKLLAIPLIALVVLIVAIIVIVNITKYQRIDAKDLFKFEFEGIDGHGTVTGELNSYDPYVYKLSSAKSGLSALGDAAGIDTDDLDDLDDLYDSLGEESSKNGDKVSPYFSLNEKELLDAWTKADTRDEAYEKVNALLKTNKSGKYYIKANFDKKKNLKNGDKVKVTVTYDEEYLKEYNIKLTDTEFEITVKNLEKGKKYDPFDKDIISVTFEGIDGNGRMDYTLNDDDYYFSYDYDKYSGLSNGDEVEFTATCYADVKKAGDSYYFEADDEYYLIENKKITKKYKVEGLTEVQEVDPFENIEFDYSAATPFLTVDSVNKDNMDDLLKDNVSYTIKDGEGLKVGDKFTVEAKDYWDGLSSQGYKLKDADDEGVATKEFTVDDNVPSFVTASNGAEAYTSLGTIITDKVTDIRKDIADSYVYGVDVDGRVESIDSFDLVDVYVAFTDKANYDSWEDTNILYGLYKVTVTTDDEDNPKGAFYTVIKVSNIVKDGDTYRGKYVDSDIYTSSENVKNMEEFNKKFVSVEGYTVTKASAAEATTTTAKADDKKETTTTTAKADDKKETTTTAKADDKKETTTTTAKTDDKAETTTTTTSAAKEETTTTTTKAADKDE